MNPLKKLTGLRPRVVAPTPEPQPDKPSPGNTRVPVATRDTLDRDDPENLEAQYLAPHSVAPEATEFARIQSQKLYDPSFNESITQAGKACLAQFPTVPPLSLPDVIELSPKKKNHAEMRYGFVQYNLTEGVNKGETANCYGDDFCQVHAVTRVFVVDRANHLIAMCTPMRYMCYMANQMYVPEDLRFKGNIFEFGGANMATPRWAMRAAAWNILNGQNGRISRVGNTISITGSEMVRGMPRQPDRLLWNIPYSGASWIVMDKWLEEARDHKVSFVAADTGLTELVGRFDADTTLPLVIRENEADMLMGDPVINLTWKDDRFHTLTKARKVNEETKALQFRAGWYAPYNPTGITRIMRRLEFATDENGIYADDGSGPWKKPTEAYSKDYLRPPSHHHLWVIGGVDDVHNDAAAKDLGTHLEMEGVNLGADSGGLQPPRT